MVSPRSISSSSYSTAVSRDTFSERSRKSSMSSHLSYASSGSQKCSEITDNLSPIPNLLFHEGQLSHRRRLGNKTEVVGSSISFTDNIENEVIATPTPLSRQTTKLPNGVWYCQVPPRPAFFPYHNNSVFLPTGQGKKLIPQLSSQPLHAVSHPYIFTDKPARKIRRRSYSGIQMKGCTSSRALATVVPCSYASRHSNGSGISLPGSLTPDKLNLLRKIRQMITNKKKPSILKKKPLSKVSTEGIPASSAVSRSKKRRSFGEPLIAGPEYSNIHAY